MGLPLQLRVIGGFLLLTSFFALIFDVLYIWTNTLGHDALDAMRASAQMAIPLWWHLALLSIVPLGLLLLAGTYSALAGRRWGLCMFACVCAMASALVTFYYTAIIGTSALIFIAQSRSEFVDLIRNPLPPSRNRPGADPEESRH